MRYPDFIKSPFDFPPFHSVQMKYPDQHIADAENAVMHQMDTALSNSGIRAGDRVAIAVGSRGIDRLPQMVRVMCNRIKTIGAIPMIIPAMGSHGGATAEGQRNLLERLGISEAGCGAPIISSMDAVQIGTLHAEVPVYFSTDALKMDHTISINRIKPHTKFKAPLESGLMKMLCVGLGKHQGALSWHHFSLKYGFFDLLCAMGDCLIEKSNFRFGIAVVENARDEAFLIEAIPANQIRSREEALLEIAKAHFPRLPIRTADVLVVGNIGKEISGAGMDPNVTGRSYDYKESDFSINFKATRTAILNISKKSDGNGIGLGNADFITEKVYHALDYEKTVMNALTSNSIRKAFIPVRLPTDEKAIQACFTTLGPIVAEAVRAVIIRDTRNLSEFWVSEGLRGELEKIPNVWIGERLALQFTPGGDLLFPSV